MPLSTTAIHERDAYRAVFPFGGTLYGLEGSLVRNVPAAAKSVRDFTAEVIARLAPATRPAKVA